MFYEFNHLGSPNYLKIERNCNFSFPPHLHQCFECIILLSGSMKVTVDKHAYTLHAGEALLIFPNQIHALESEQSEHILCIFSPRLVSAYHSGLVGKLPKDNQFTPHPHYVETLKQLRQNSSISEKKGLLYSLCAQFDITAKYNTKQTDTKDLLHKIFSFVEDHFSADCSLSMLANSLGYDHSYLSRFFKKMVGIPFNAYVNHYRLSHACYLMENTSLSIIECAFESGFTSIRSFNRNFQKQYEMPPKAFRGQKESLII